LTILLFPETSLPQSFPPFPLGNLPRFPVKELRRKKRVQILSPILNWR
jgi:hypothetical protein